MDRVHCSLPLLSLLASLPQSEVIAILASLVGGGEDGKVSHIVNHCISRRHIPPFSLGLWGPVR